MTTPPIRILIVDDNPDVADSLAELLSLQNDMQSAGVLHRADGLVDHVTAMRPDVILLDLSMPGADPIQQLQSLAALEPPARVVVCSAYEDAPRVKVAMDAGARGYVSKLDEVDSILDAVRAVARGGTYMGPRTIS
jgi:two-component system, NarL family, invasion response regulator UvrY